MAEVDPASRVLLVGYGMAGRLIHTPLLVQVGVAPSVVVTTDATRTAQAHTELPGAAVVPSLAAGLAEGVDLVVIASPSGAHEEQALACIEAGVPVVIDKPIAVDAAGARRIVTAAEASGVPLTVFQNRRWDAENRTLAALLGQAGSGGEAGPLGRVHRFERRWERWRPRPESRWRETAGPEQGGGLLLDLGTHLVDSAMVLFGPVRAVYAELSCWTTRAEDELFLALEHVNGVRSHLTASSVAGAPGPRTRVLGSQAAYVVTEFDHESHVFGFDNAPGCTGWLVTGAERRPVPTAPGDYVDFYAAVLAALALPDPAARRAALPVNPQDAVRVLEVLDAARLSALEGRVVRW